MKLDIVYCRHCDGLHAPGAHTKHATARKPGDPPPPPPRSSWDSKPPAKPATKPKPVKRAPPPRPKAPDFVATDPSSTPPLPPPPNKTKPEYFTKQKLLMRQKRAAEKEGLGLEAWRAKHGATFVPPRQRRPKRQRKAPPPR